MRDWKCRRPLIVPGATLYICRSHQSDAGRDAYIIAASQAFRRNYRPMEAIIRQALETARKEP